MSKIKKYANIRIMGIVFISLLLFLQSCMEIGSNEVLYECVSPNKEYVAYVFLRDVGATSKASYQLTITGYGHELSDNMTGNIFISYGEFGVRWISDSELVVEKKTSGEEFKKRYKYKDITITYK